VVDVPSGTAGDARVFVVDLKNGGGTVTDGLALPSLARGKVASTSSSTADITLWLSDEDLEALAAGRSLRDLYQRGQVRISGDMRIAPKLNFFKGLV